MPHKNPEARKAYQRAYKLAHRKQKRLNAYFYDKSKHANMRARKYGAPGILRTADIRLVLAGNPSCAYCNGNNGPWPIGIDHVIPLHVQGPNDLSNIVPCCQSCNARKRRSTHPGAWASDFQSCIECSKTDRPHVSKGRCARCYSRHQGQIRRARLKRARVAKPRHALEIMELLRE